MSDKKDSEFSLTGVSLAEEKPCGFESTLCIKLYIAFKSAIFGFEI
jgi:hypothetical protein